MFPASVIAALATIDFDVQPGDEPARARRSNSPRRRRQRRAPLARDVREEALPTG
jgi:hypothetical protein